MKGIKKSETELTKLALSETTKNRISLYMATKVKAETELNIYMQAILDSHGLIGDWNLNTKGNEWFLEPVIKPEPPKLPEGAKV